MINVVHIRQWPMFLTEHAIRDHPLCFYFYALCYVAVLLKFTYYNVQYYTPEQELYIVNYYAVYMQFYVNNSLHVAL